MLKKILIMISISMCSYTAYADEASDKAAIEAAVYDYFHGQGEASHERLFRAFAAEHTTMVGVTKGDDGQDNIRSWKDMTTVLNAWASNENPAGGDRDGEIISMNMVDGRLAVVLFRSTNRFFDALTLSKINDEWKIVGKAFVLQ
ncbi:nuclear transport factor 2 family protein [Kordiimonas aquimaris]|uniref:nuclear transport factor 2 family protein n=1 Tax=Kordiimonas aquimaris TaxID=707591 RepID=UPI0021CEB106|nr:nuclear transport factor 2 family protein [Kordiimonas aquimaris]